MHEKYPRHSDTRLSDLGQRALRSHLALEYHTLDALQAIAGAKENGGQAACAGCPPVDPDTASCFGACVGAAASADIGGVLSSSSAPAAGWATRGGRGDGALSSQQTMAREAEKEAHFLTMHSEANEWGQARHSHSEAASASDLGGRKGPRVAASGASDLGNPNSYSYDGADLLLTDPFAHDELLNLSLPVTDPPPALALQPQP